MFKLREYIPASEIWSNAKTHIDHGSRSSLVRGYNIEVTTKNGTTDWLSCEWIHENPQECFNDEFHNWMYKEHNWIPTGRICFRGYGMEKYDPEERDYFVYPIEE